MSYSNYTVSAPIDIKRDIGNVVAGGNGDLGFCVRYGSIKTWAKYKPYRSTSLTTASDSVRGDYPIYFGMSFPQFGSPSSAASSGDYLFDPYDDDTASSARAAMNGWQYLKPRGRNSADGNEWYRAMDFDGYYHAATEPLVISSGSISASTNLQTEATISALIKETFNAGEINFATMQGIKNYYYCLVGYRLEGDKNPNTIFVVSTSSKVSNGLYSATIAFNGANFPSNRLGTWEIYPCLCSVGGISFYQKASDSLPSATYIPLPCTKKWTANIASNQRTADLYGRKVSTNKTKAYYRFRINNDGAAYTFSGVRLWFLHNYHTPSDTMISDEKYIDLGDITLAANGTYDTGTTYLEVDIQSSLWPDLTLYATCSAGFDRVGPIMPLTPSTT